MKVGTIRNWRRYTAEERFDYEIQLRNMKIAMPFAMGIAFIIGILFGLIN